MAYQHKPDRGSLFRNDKKQKESDPDYKGDGLVNGQEVWISGWLNDGKNGKYLSLAFSEKKAAHDKGMAQAQQAAAPEDAGGGPDNFEDDIPFDQYEKGRFA